MSPKSLRLALVAAEFNRAIVDAMAATAEEEAASAGASITLRVRVPGTYDFPLPVARALKRVDVDAVIALGFIERGETLHGEVMGHVVHRALVELALQNNKPVGLGIIGPGATLEQAEVRKERHARNAVRAALAQLALGQLD